MSMHEWVAKWQNINLFDCFDGQHLNVMVVQNEASRVFECIEEINQYLLEAESSRTLINRSPAMPRGKVVFLFFDQTIEATCRNLGVEIALPRHALVRDMDSKIVTTEVGIQAGVSSVPCVLTKIASYDDLRKAAQSGGFGERCVVQTAYGDSGKTTFFISTESDYKRVSRSIEKEERVKVMRWIRCTGSAIEACATRWGTFVGPLMTELIGIDTLTPYPGGWCGNELYEAAFTPEIRRQVRDKTQAMGDALYERGYRGYFELDYLIDLDTNEVFLGELNARITGISAMTNSSDFCESTIPLFLFHLLEFDDGCEIDIDVDAYNQMVLEHGAIGVASQVILKYTDDPLKIVTRAPVSGVYTMDDTGTLVLKNAGYRRRDALAENEAYVMRIIRTGECAYKGGDLGIMFMNCVIRNTEGVLNADGVRWVTALKACFEFRNLNQIERSRVELEYNPANAKSGRSQ